MRLGVTIVPACGPSTSRSALAWTRPSAPIRLPKVHFRGSSTVVHAAPDSTCGDLEHQINGQNQGTSWDDSEPRRTAWNKGVPVPDNVRRKVSSGIKKKWQDPEYRQSVTNALKGKPAWNKGRTVSEETREKMRMAKLNHPVSRATRQKMSQARMGRSLTPEAAAAVSARLTGKPKSEEHRQNIAQAQRRRHAAARVLTAVEAVYQKTSESSTEPGSNPNVAAAALSSMVASDGKRLPKNAFLNAFKSELREYRALQDELSPWVAAFQEKHSRKPSLADVQRTGIDWLWTRYSRYVMLRQRLFSETSLLRNKMTVNGQQQGVNGNKTDNDAGPINANRGTAPTSAAVNSRMAAAASYKRSKTAAAAAAAAPAPAPSTTSTRPSSTSVALESTLAAAGPHVPNRLKLAMQHAIDYRNMKAQATREAAEAAVAVAKASPSIKSAVNAASALSTGAAPPGAGNISVAPSLSSSSAVPQSQNPPPGSEEIPENGMAAALAALAAA